MHFRVLTKDQFDMLMYNMSDDRLRNRFDQNIFNFIFDCYSFEKEYRLHVEDDSSVSFEIVMKIRESFTVSVTFNETSFHSAVAVILNINKDRKYKSEEHSLMYDDERLKFVDALSRLINNRHK